MAPKGGFCANHPDISATESCRQCGKPLCYNCVLRVFRTPFCGVQCLSIRLAKGFVDGLFGFFRTVLKIVFAPLVWLKRRSLRTFVELVLGAGLIFCFFFLWKLDRTLHTLKTEREKTAAGWVDTTRISPPKIFEPTEGGMVHTNMLSVIGEVEENRIVSLSIDGHLAHVILPQGRKFSFDHITLHRGENRLEVRALSQDGNVSVLQSLVLTLGTPTLAYLMRDFLQGPLKVKEIALTFDAGSQNNAADEILDILKENGVKSTFFVTGEFIRKYPKTVKRIVSEGHEVGNHTWSHPHLTTFAANKKQTTVTGMTSDRLRNELGKTSSLFEVVAKQTMTGLWRAPYGEYNPEILGWAARAGYKHVGWTIGKGWEESMDTMDWVADKTSKAYKSSEEIVQKILEYSKGKKTGANGAVILMHLGTERKDDFPHRKLPEIIQGLRKDGYTLVRVSEMLPGE